MEFKVLIVDDAKEIRDMLKSMFMEWADDNKIDLDIREYECGNDCIYGIKNRDWIPDIASVDFMMENGDGSDVVVNLRTITKHAPILVITAWSESEGFNNIIDECVIVSKTDINVIDDAISKEMSDLKVKFE
jgi:CheY-like chemotaxis protein